MDSLSQTKTNTTMSLLAILFTLIIVGVVLYLINRYIPMDASIKQIINVVAVVIVLIWLLKVFGFFHYIQNIKV